MGTRTNASTRQDRRPARSGATSPASRAARPARSGKPVRPAGTDALALLREDHHKVEKLFDAFARMKADGDPGDKAELVRQACEELLVHAAVEEEIFYPAVRKATRQEELMNEARVEHAEAKGLISQIQAMDPQDEMFDAKVTVLGEYVRHHVQEEQDEMFPKVLEAGLDLDLLGRQILKRKEALLPGRD